MERIWNTEPILSDRSVLALNQSVPLSPDLREHLKELKEKYAFSARLLLTYQIVLLGVVLAFSLKHRHDVAALSHSRRYHNHEHQNGKERTSNRWLSGILNQTRAVDITSHQESVANGEELPLLAPFARKHRIRNMWTRWQSFLMYQPRPLPVLGRTMPSNATSLLVVSLFGLNVFYLLFRIDAWTIDTPSLLGNRASWVFVANLPWLYFLAAKHQPLQALTGYSYENLNIIHRRLGEWLAFLAALHAFGMVLSWYNFLRPIGLPLGRFLTIAYIFFGVMAFICYGVLYLTSLASFRAWWYEMFLGFHIVLQVAALVLLMFHHHLDRPSVSVSLAIVVVDRVFLRLGTKTRSFRADLKILDDGHTVLISADWPVIAERKWSCSSLTERSVCRGWRPGQHVFLTIPALGRKHPLQAHPFTVASAAPGDNAKHAWFNLLIRAQTGFSQDLLKFASTNSSATVRIDGPYGSTHALEVLKRNKTCIFVAGGSGIAVAYPMLWECLHVAEQAPTQALNSQYHLIWIVQDVSHLSWIGHERLAELGEKGLHVTIPPPTRNNGRPDVASLLRDLIPEKPGSDIENLGISVVVSGPDQLNRSVRNTCAKMVGEGLPIDVTVEKYGW